MEHRDGLTHAYLDDLCRRLRHEEVDAVIESVLLLRKLAEKAAEASGPQPLQGQPVGLTSSGLAPKG